MRARTETCVRFAIEGLLKGRWVVVYSGYTDAYSAKQKAEWLATPPTGWKATRVVKETRITRIKRKVVQ